MNTFLLCPPTHFAAHFLGNPWMAWWQSIDGDRAAREWERLRDLLADHGARVVVLPPDPGAGAMTFARDAALVYAPGHAFILRNDGPRGEVEPPLVDRWFAGAGYRTEIVPRRVDGGNLLRCADGRFLIGLKPGATGRVERYLARLLGRLGGARCFGVPLADPRYLHLDMVLADLCGRGWLVYPAGLAGSDFSHPAWGALFRGRPIIEVAPDEASRLACNVVTVGRTVIGSGLSPRLVRSIRALGCDVAVTGLDEFRKAGGGAHCLTLELEASAAAGGT